MNPLVTLTTLIRLEQEIPTAVLVAAIQQLARKDRQMAKTIAEAKAELQAGLDANRAKIEAQTSVIGGVKTLLEGLVAQNAAQRVQIEELLRNGGDATVLQPVLDMLAAQDEAIQANTDAMAAAVAANTPNQTQG